MIQPVDLFPHTEHTECIVVVSRWVVEKKQKQVTSLLPGHPYSAWVKADLDVWQIESKLLFGAATYLCADLLFPESAKLLFFYTSRISGQTAVASDYTMARNQNGDFIVSHSLTYSLGRHLLFAILFRDLFCDLPVGHGLSIGNCTENSHTSFWKFVPVKWNGTVKSGSFPEKYRSSHCFVRFSTGSSFFLIHLIKIEGKIFLPFKP